VAAVCGLWLHWGHSTVIAIAAVITVLVVASWVAQEAHKVRR